MALASRARRLYLGLALAVVVGGGGLVCQAVTMPSMPGQTSHVSLHHHTTGSASDTPALQTTPLSFFALLGAGLLTGLSHCVGMCGPLVGAFAMRRRVTQRDIAAPLVLFQCGRLGTYGLLGGVAGSVGAAFAATLHTWQGMFAIGMGLLATGAGAGLLGIVPLQHWLALARPGQWLHGRLVAAIDSQHPLAPVGLGVANGCLPCGAVYTMLLLAAISLHPLKGAGLMLLFGLGTLPAMLGMGYSVSLLRARLRSRLYHWAAVLMLVAGVQLTLRGLALKGHIAHMAIGGMMLW